MGDQIRVAAQARCSPEQLWHALVDHRAAWWPEMDFTASPGAALTERLIVHPSHDDGGNNGGGGNNDDGGAEARATGTVLAVARDRLLSFRWTMPGWKAHTVVSFTLGAGTGPDADADYTDVVITESGLGTLAEGNEVARLHTEAWADHLATLIRLAEQETRP